MDAFSVDLDAALDQLEAEMAGTNQQPMQSMLLDSSTSHELSSDASKLPTASSSNSASAANGDCNGQAHSATSVTIVYAQQPTALPNSSDNSVQQWQPELRWPQAVHSQSNTFDSFLVDSAPVSEPVDSAPVSEPVDSAPVSEPVDSAPVSEPVDSAPVSERVDVDSAPVSEPVDSAPVSEHVDSAPVIERVDVDSAPVSESVGLAPVSALTSDIAPVDSAPVSAPAYSAPVSAPAYSAPVSAPAYSAPVSAPAYSAPVSAPANSTAVNALLSAPMDSSLLSDPVPTSVPNASAGAPAEEESALNNNLAAPTNTSKAINNPANSAAVASPSTSASNSIAEASSNPTSLVSSIRFADLAKGLPDLTEADLELILEQEPAQPTQQSAVLQSQWSRSNYQDYAEQDEQTSSFNPMYGLVGGAGCLATEAAVSSSQIADSNPGTVGGGGGLNPMYSLQEERQQPASLGATGGGVTSPPSPPPPPQQLTDAAESDAEPELQTDLPSQNDVAEDVAESETPPQQQPLGSVKPAWIPDSEAPVCMQCEARFTVLRRRHHCRACGRVFCANCAAYTARLAFLDNDKARVCAVCYQELIRLESNPEARSVSQQPPVSVLKSTRSQVVRSRSVVFSDGIRPGGDLLEDNAGDADDFQVNDSTVGGVAAAAAVSSFPAESSSSSSSLEPSLLPADWESYPPHEPLPTDDSNSGAVALSPEAALRNGGSVTYQVTMNISAQCRLVSLPCCGHPSAWLLVTRGLDSVGQTDLLLLLSRRPPAIDGTDESILPPLHLLHLVYAVYERAYAGSWARHLSFVGWHAGRPLLGDRSNAGWLFFRPSRLHCLQNLGMEADLVCRQLLCGLLVLRWEAPWAELFPERLLLRLGSESRLYPSPLVSVRDRAPVFGELGRSLIGLLADFRNFTYTLPAPPGLRVHLRAGCTSVLCPTASYAAVQKALAQCQPDAKVLAFGAEFSPSADAHLVCHQNMETGDYSTEAVSAESRQLATTAGLFVVFNAGGFAASRASIVEDGVMVQLTDAQLTQLMDSLKAMRNWSAVCQQPQAQASLGFSAVPDGSELIEFRWLDDDETDFDGDDADVSPIDGAPLTGAGRQAMPIAAGQQQRQRQSCRRIRWTLASLLRDADQTDGTPADSLRIAGHLAGAVCQALDGCAPELLAYGQRILAVRARLGPDSLHYEAAASGGATLLAEGAAERLDQALVPALSELGRGLRSELALELRFVCLYA
ncbi:hypothetical protein BOX15_Mlig029677g1 [Macrostomum lignano]|uniref:FYVE-type domain-containing protein n=2 Tax=Macrostomum lignano TaxID=282301 RepID=A0A267GH37_9PLAT|nr:hypothetical protein BOX15_Mlig029677g1 [Macrostomum lignano]